jgi:hypothetical protein
MHDLYVPHQKEKLPICLATFSWWQKSHSSSWFVLLNTTYASVVSVLAENDRYI